MKLALAPSLAVALLILSEEAGAEPLQMEYDYGLETGDLELGVLSYYTPAKGLPAGARDDEVETIFDLRLQVTRDWSTVVKLPAYFRRYEDASEIEYVWGPGDLEWTQHFRILGAAEQSSLVGAFTLKLPTGLTGLELGTGTTDLALGVLGHLQVDDDVDLYLQLEYQRAFLGRPTPAPGDIFTHNAGASLWLGDEWQLVLEVLGTLTTPAAGEGTGSYSLDLAPGVIYEVVEDRFWLASSLFIALLQTGDFPDGYGVVFNLSLYFDTSVF